MEFIVKKQIALTLSAFVMLSVAGCHGSGGSGNLTADVATVNGTAITAKDFYDYIVRKPTVEIITNRGVAEAPVVQSIGLQALRDLVNRQLILEMAKDQGVFPSDQDIDAEIKFRTAQNPNYMNILRQQNISLDLIRRDIQLELARYRIVTKGITVTPAEVDKYIKDHPEAFRRPAAIQSKFIQVSTPDKQNQVDSALKSGQDFTQVAIRFSEAPNVRATQAAVAQTDPDKLPPEVRNPLTAALEGSSTSWLHLGPNYYKFYVVKKVPSQNVPITDTVREAVKRGIAQEKGSKAIDLNQRIQDSLKKSTIDVKLEAIQPEWKRAMDSLKNGTPGGATVPPTGSTAGAAPTTAGAPAGTAPAGAAPAKK
jgi:hypothetical protein